MQLGGVGHTGRRETYSSFNTPAFTRERVWPGGRTLGPWDNIPGCNESGLNESGRRKTGENANRRRRGHSRSRVERGMVGQMGRFGHGSVGGEAGGKIVEEVASWPGGPDKASLCWLRMG